MLDIVQVLWRYRLAILTQHLCSKIFKSPLMVCPNVVVSFKLIALLTTRLCGLAYNIDFRQSSFTPLRLPPFPLVSRSIAWGRFSRAAPAGVSSLRVRTGRARAKRLCHGYSCAIRPLRHAHRPPAPSSLFPIGLSLLSSIRERANINFEQGGQDENLHQERQQST